MMKALIQYTFAACLTVLCLAPTLAQTPSKPKPMTVEELALYTGADRQERLIEAAKKEGTLTLYHVYPSLPNVAAAFTKKYGIQVKTWRAGSEAVLQKVSAEFKANKFDVDIVQNNPPENEAAYRERMLQEVRSIHHADLIPAAVPAHRQWVGITSDIWTAAYNTSKISKQDLPKTYADLLNPKWKGMLGIEGNNHVWFGNLMAEMGEEQGLKLFNQLTATNGISVRKGHSLLTMLVASNEVPLALTVYSWNPEALKLKGANIEGLALQPLIAQVSTIAMMKRAPHPHAALLFYDFMIGEGQKILQSETFVPTSKKIPNAFSQMPVKYIDGGVALDQNARWIKLFEENVTKKSK
jgi:iron(III) transport system substrate-binding protein